MKPGDKQRRNEWCKSHGETMHEIELLEVSTLAAAYAAYGVPLKGSPKARFTATSAVCLACRASAASARAHAPTTPPSAPHA